jgi:hypothetical protein
VDRGQSTLLPASLDDYVTEDNPVRAVDVFVDGLDLDKLGFVGVQPLDTGRPSYHPGVMLSRRGSPAHHVGGKGGPSFDIDVFQKNFGRNTATATANKGGAATAFNVGGDQSNASLIQIG